VIDIDLEASNVFKLHIKQAQITTLKHEIMDLRAKVVKTTEDVDND